MGLFLKIGAGRRPDIRGEILKAKENANERETRQWALIFFSTCFRLTGIAATGKTLSACRN